MKVHRLCKVCPRHQLCMSNSDRDFYKGDAYAWATKITVAFLRHKHQDPHDAFKSALKREAASFPTKVTAPRLFNEEWGTISYIRQGGLDYLPAHGALRTVTGVGAVMGQRRTLLNPFRLQLPLAANLHLNIRHLEGVHSDVLFDCTEDRAQLDRPLPDDAGHEAHFPRQQRILCSVFFPLPAIIPQPGGYDRDAATLRCVCAYAEIIPGLPDSPNGPARDPVLFHFEAPTSKVRDCERVEFFPGVTKHTRLIPLKVNA